MLSRVKKNDSVVVLCGKDKGKQGLVINVDHKKSTAVVKDIEAKHKKKTIMLVSHEGPLFLLQGNLMGLTIKQTIKKFNLDRRIHKAEIREIK